GRIAPLLAGIVTRVTDAARGLAAAVALPLRRLAATFAALGTRVFVLLRGVATAVAHGGRVVSTRLRELVRSVVGSLGARGRPLVALVVSLRSVVAAVAERALAAIRGLAEVAARALLPLRRLAAAARGVLRALGHLMSVAGQLAASIRDRLVPVVAGLAGTV